MAPSKSVKTERPSRYHVRLTKLQNDAITEAADAAYRTPQQQVQMLLDSAIKDLHAAPKALREAYAEAKSDD